MESLIKQLLRLENFDRSNAEVSIRVDECERSNPSSREESLAGGVTVLDLYCFELMNVGVGILCNFHCWF